jgi:hypothetical protein
MIQAVWQPYPGYRRVGRMRPLVVGNSRMTAREMAILLAAGLLAAAAVALVSPSWRMPGSAILRAGLPMVLGVALVPRRMSGTVMGVGAFAGWAALVLGGWGHWQPAAVVSLVSLGPAIDLALGPATPTGWRLYLRFALAGALANAAAFGVRAGTSLIGLDSPGGHNVARFGLMVFLSFVACGAVAGLLGAAAGFRWSARDARAE